MAAWQSAVLTMLIQMVEGDLLVITSTCALIIISNDYARVQSRTALDMDISAKYSICGIPGARHNWKPCGNASCSSCIDNISAPWLHGVVGKGEARLAWCRHTVHYLVPCVILSYNLPSFHF